MRRLTPAERWIWVSILAAARESCVPGCLMVAEGVPYDWVDLADYAGTKAKEAQVAVEKMAVLGMVAWDAEMSAWLIPSWEARQYESDDVASRVAKHRYMKQRNDVTKPDLVTTSSVSVSDSVSDVSKRTADFDRFYAIYPRKAAPDAARKAWDKAIKRATVDEIISGAERFRDDPNRDDEFTAHPASWLNAGRWNDDPLPRRTGRPVAQRRQSGADAVVDELRAEWEATQ